MASISKEELFDMLRDLINDGNSRVTKKEIDLDKFEDSIKKVDNQLKSLRSSVDKTRGSYADQAARSKRVADVAKEEIEALEDLIDSLKDAGRNEEAKAVNTKRFALEEIKQAAESKAANAGFMASLTDGKAHAKVFGNTLVSVAKTTSGVLKDLQSGASASTVANNVLLAGLTLAGQAGSGAGAGLMAAGSAGIASGNKMVKLGSAAALAAGSLLKIGAPAVTEAMKFALEFLGKEFENIAQGFSKVSATGAVFANGMQGMINAAADANLTLQQFGEVVSKNASDLAASGLGMSAAVTRLGKIKVEIDKSGIGTSLQKLGYSFEEQAGLVAEVMGQMNVYGKGRLLGDKEIAAETEKYARDLKLLSSLTGQDAKARMEQARQAANQLAFQNKLAEMAPEQAEAIKRSMALMTAEERKATMETVVLGSVVNKTGAVMMSMNEGFSRNVTEMSERIRSGTLTPEETARIRANNRELVLSQRGATQALAVGAMAAGKNTEMAEGFSAFFLDIAKSPAPEDLQEYLSSLAEGARTADLKTQEFMAAQAANQRAMVEAQGLAIDNMNEYSKLVKDVNTAIADALAKLREMTGNRSVVDMIKDNLLALGSILGLGVAGLAAGYLKGKGGGGAPPPAAGTGGTLARIGGGLVRGGPLAIGGVAADIAAGAIGRESGAGKAVGTAGSALTGAGTGAMIGSIVPGVGTVIGAGVGGAIGAGYGLYSNYFSNRAGTSTATATMPARPTQSFGLEMPAPSAITGDPATRAAQQAAASPISTMAGTEIRDIMSRQVERSSQITRINEDMLTALRENNNLMRQLAQAMA
jgi:hypothetical protein